jgi:hypothetical protein
MFDLCGRVAGDGHAEEEHVNREREKHSRYLPYLTVARYSLSAVSVLVVAQPISDVPEVSMNYPVY